MHFSVLETSLTETVIERFSTLRFSMHATRQNYGTIQLQGTAG